MHVALTIFGIALLVFLHELGHYLAAKAFNMRVLRFSLGFGPALFTHRRGETDWQVGALPLGGAVQVDGMGMREDDVVDDERNYRNRPAWQRAIVVAAGPATNWLLAALFVAALGVTAGVSRPDGTATIGYIAEDSPASEAGFLEGDRIVAVDGENIQTWDDLVAAIQSRPDQSSEFDVVRDGESLRLNATPKAGAQGGLLGIGPNNERVRYGALESIQAGVAYAWNGCGQLFSLLGGMLTGTRDGELSGLPGIVRTVSAQAKVGIDRLVQTLAWLSVSLCVLNLVPIPGLDGGRLSFLLVEAIRGRPAPERVEVTVNSVGVMLVLLLVVVISIRDLL
ncbi:MAG: RIP metalloprotease RseP [Myxococcota bacterium]